jgi:hypothetical protein
MDTSGPLNRLLVKIWMLLPTPLPPAFHGFWKKLATWSAIGRPPRESEYLDLMQDEEDTMGAIVGASITYRLTFGPNAGRKALTLQTVPVRTESRKGEDLVSKQAGFSLHAGIACKSHQRKKLERLCRYITRPAIAERRLSLANNGNVVIALKTPYDDGTTHVVLSPMEFMGRLAALVPRSRVNLTRFHGVFSPNSKLREYVVPQKPVEEQENPKPKAYSMTHCSFGAQRLKRVLTGRRSASKSKNARSAVVQFGSSHLLKIQMLFRRS